MRRDDGQVAERRGPVNGRGNAPVVVALKGIDINGIEVATEESIGLARVECLSLRRCDPKAVVYAQSNGGCAGAISALAKEVAYDIDSQIVNRHHTQREPTATLLLVIGAVRHVAVMLCVD